MCFSSAMGSLHISSIGTDTLGPILAFMPSSWVSSFSAALTTLGEAANRLALFMS